MLVNSRDIKIEKPQEQGKPDPVVSSFPDSESLRFISNPDKILTKTIDKIERGKAIHFYSHGNFNLVRLLVHLIKHIGPTHVMMTSYSFSQRSIEQINRLMEQKQIRSFRVLIDNRVRVMSPKPFQMLKESFDYRCSSIHAKVALLWNQDWKVTVVTSQNATDNPKLERGIIFTDPEIFDFDLQVLNDEFERGTT